MPICKCLEITGPNGSIELVPEDTAADLSGAIVSRSKDGTLYYYAHGEITLTPPSNA